MKPLYLDLGSGLRPNFFPDADVIHLDISGDAPHVEIVCDLDHGIPFPKNSFDVVLATDVIEHLSSVVKIMDEIHRVLRPDGEVYITVPLFGGRNHLVDPTHLRGFHPSSFDVFDDETDYGKSSTGNLCTKRRWKILRKESDADHGDPNGNLILQMRALKLGSGPIRESWKPW